MTDTDVKAPAAGSILGRFSAAVEEQINETAKVLPVGVIPGFFCEYRALSDDEADKIRASARRRAKQMARTSRDGSDDDPEGERLAAATILAKACVQIVVPAPPDSDDEYEPLSAYLKRVEGVDVPVLRYNRDLITTLAAAGEVPGGLTAESDMGEIVTTLHRRGESTAPLLSMAALYEAWRSGVTQQILADAVG